MLALDGAVRGVLTLEYLAVIEDLLRNEAVRTSSGCAITLISIGGTSTGAIIAASLACGTSVSEPKTL